MLPLLLVTVLAADPEPFTAPKGAPPQIAQVQAVDGNLIATVTKAVPVVVQEKRVRVVDGKMVEEIVTVTRFEMVYERAPISTGKAMFSTAGGKKLDAKAALKALATPQLVALSQDGKAVDAAYLKVLKPDMLVIVTEKAEGAVPFPVRPIRPFIRPVPKPVPLPPVIRD